MNMEPDVSLDHFPLLKGPGLERQVPCSLVGGSGFRGVRRLRCSLQLLIWARSAGDLEYTAWLGIGVLGFGVFEALVKG